MQKVLIIAEVAQAHDGSLAFAHSYIDAIAASGADAVKFQMHIAEEESSKEELFRISPKYPQDHNRFDYWKRMEFTESQWIGLKDHAEKSGLIFLCTPFSIKAAHFLQKIGIVAWKISSGEIENYPLLEYVAESGKPVILSTGMSDYKEITTAVKKIKASGACDITLLQCTSEYPCKPQNVGLNLLQEYTKKYEVKVGLSDHSGTIFPSLAAIYFGATVLEVHVTFNRQMFGFDAPSSLTFDELNQLVDGVNFGISMLNNPVDKNIQIDSVAKIKDIFGKGLVAKRRIYKGEIIKIEDLKFLKPCTGISIKKIYGVIGKTAKIDISSEAPINWDDLN